MIIRLCKGCYALAVKASIMDRVRKLIEQGKWVCVHGKAECGSKVQ